MSHSHPYLPLAGGTMNQGSHVVFPGTSTDTNYGGSIEFREVNYVTTSQTDWSYSPGITFHWGGRSVGKLGLKSDGNLAWRNQTIIHSGNIGSQSVNYSASAGNADTLDSFHSNRFTFVYNSTNYNNSSSLTLNQMAADGNSNSHVGMIYAGTDNPVSSSGNWVHVWSQSWSRGSISSWCSQIALGVQQGTGMWYRTTSGALAGRAWNRVLDSANYTSYVNNYYWANVKISTSSNSATYPTFGSLAVINDSCDNSNNSLAYFQHRSNNDWTVKIDSGSYDYGLQINGSQTGTNALSVTGASRFTNTIRIGNGSTALDGNYCEGIRIRAADNTWATIILGATADTGTNTYAWSIHRTSGNNFSISRNSSDGANGLLIDTSGRVGIGTTSPSERLSVNGWVGTIGNTGWYSITYAGGIYMTDSTWVRVYNNKKFYVSNSSSDAIHSAGGVYVAGMIHSYANYLKSTCNGAYVQIGPQNRSHAHYVTDATVSHWFNKTVQVDGNIEPYGNNEHSAGSTSYRFSNVYSYSGNFAGTITSSSYHQIYNSGSYTKPSSSVTGAIVIQLPITSSQYDMINVEIAVYEYNSQAASKIIVGGHPWKGKWYNYSCSVIGGYSREIRLGIYGGKWSIILGTSSTVWSYPGVFVTHIGTVYDTYSSAYASQCTLSLVTSESGFSALFTPTNVLKATHSAYASSAGNADTVDGQHFNWNNNKNDHTYLWAASSNGQAYLVHRASMSVNYANTASGLDLNRTSIKTGAAGWYKLAYYASTDPRGSVRIGLVTTGGSFVPFYAELYVENGWGIINMVLYGRFDYISKFRFTSDSTNCYIEGYFPNANTEITLQKIKGVSYVSDYTSSWNLYTTATPGSGTVQDSENTRSSLSSGLYTNKSIEGNGFVKSGSSDSYVLLGGGGHKAESSLSVNYASSAGSATIASTVTVNSSDANSTYRMVWHSGNTLYGTGGIYCNPSSDYLYATSVQTSDWFRSTGTSGWYSESYGGGWYMTDSTWVRSYNGKGVVAGGFYHSSYGSANYLLTSNGGAWAVHTGRNNEANKIIRTDGNGYIQAGWINTTSGDMGTTAATRVYCSDDGYIRYKSLANFSSDVAGKLYWANVNVSTSSNSGTYPTFANMKSTGRVYLDEWIQFSGSSGLYWPNTNGAHLYANTTTSYAGLITQGSRGGYCGLQCGPGTTYMTVMSSDTHHGLYCENTGTWEFYYNRGNGGVGIRTSSITKNFNVGGQSYLSSNVWIGTTSGGEMLNVGGWVGTTGNTGWYSITHGGGLYMEDSTYIRVYNSKRIYNANTSQYAFYTSGGMTALGHMYSNSSSCSWIAGQNATNAALNIGDATNTGSYWPWFRQTNTSSKKWFSVGTLNNSLYFIGSATSRTANSYDYGFRMDFSDGYLYGNFSGYLSGRAAEVTVNNSDSNSTYRMVWHSGNTLYGTGGIYCNPSTDTLYASAFYESSDIRLKQNIKHVLTSNDIPQIKEFDWKNTGKHSYGLIAQELESMGYSELVDTKDDGYKSVNYTAALCLIIGKLQLKIKELEDKIKSSSI